MVKRFNGYVAERDSARFSVLLILSLLSISQALSPYPYLLAVALLLEMVARKGRSLAIGYLALATVLCAFVIVSQMFASSLATVVRLLSSCLLIALAAPLRFGEQPTALARARTFVLLSLILSSVGFVYALAGGPPLASIDNPDGREALLFLTTLSNSVFPTSIGNLIRPSFIYDEPGAYAFVIDFVLLANYIVHRKLSKGDWWLIIGGMLTFSVAHMIVSTLIMVAERRALRVALVAALAVALDLYVSAQSGVSLILDRFTVADGGLAGDNRSQLLQNGLKIIGESPFGVGSRCNFEIQVCNDMYGAFGENPAFPAAFFGIAGAAGYYLLLALMLWQALRLRSAKHAFAILAIVALIAQRPFLFNLGYNLLIVFLFHLAQGAPGSRRPRKRGAGVDLALPIDMTKSKSV